MFFENSKRHIPIWKKYVYFSETVIATQICVRRRLLSPSCVDGGKLCINEADILSFSFYPLFTHCTCIWVKSCTPEELLCFIHNFRKLITHGVDSIRHPPSNKHPTPKKTCAFKRKGKKNDRKQPGKKHDFTLFGRFLNFYLNGTLFCQIYRGFVASYWNRLQISREQISCWLNVGYHRRSNQPHLKSKTMRSQRRLQGWHNAVYLNQYFRWPDQPSSGLDGSDKYEITILYSGGCRKTYFKTKRSGGNDEQNKLNKIRIKRVYVG